MLRRHGPAVAATLVLAGLISAVVVSAATPVREAHALPKTITPEPRTMVVDAKAGEEVWFTWSGTFGVRGDHRAVVTAIELVKVNPGLRVLRLRAAHTGLGAPQPKRSFLGPLAGHGYVPTSLRPVTTVVLEPGQSNDETYFIAGVVASKPGTYHLDGWRLLYRAGGVDGVSSYQQRLEIRVK